MLGMKIVIARYISDEPQPGLVECELKDVYGRRWLFVEKAAVVSSEKLDATTTYPRQGVIAGQVIQQLPAWEGQETVRFDTRHPWGVESVDGETQFDVHRSLVVQLG